MDEGVSWGNCLIKGLHRWRRNGYRGALVFTKSPNLGFRTHITDEIPRGLMSFVPVNPKHGICGWFHKVLFRGRWRRRR